MPGSCNRSHQRLKLRFAISTRLAGLVVLLALPAGLGAAPAEVVGSAYRADMPFPQFLPLWSESWALKGKDGEPVEYARTNMPLGAYVQLYIRNCSTTALPLTDVKFEGISLTEAIAFTDRKTSDLHPASIHFSKLPKADLDRLIAAGEPVWWKVEPPLLPPGEFGEVTIRLRRQPRNPVMVQVLANNTTCETRVSPGESPRFSGISFSPSLDTVYWYFRNPQQPGAAPVKVLLDGVDVTARTSMGADQRIEVAPLVTRLTTALKPGSFHCFQAIGEDGAMALAGSRASGADLVYGMWGYVNRGKTAQERVDYYLGDLQRHNVNAVMESYGGEVAGFLSGESGAEHSRVTGIRAMRNTPGKISNPVYYFLTDEPDAHDFAVRQLQPNERLGTLGQDLVRRSEEFRAQDPATPHLLNLDNTYKPENWYMYAQLADVCCADPYFQEQQRIVWNERPAWTPYFLKPLYVLGVATICSSACAPKPLHIILNSVRHDIKDGRFRFATPAEKTVELFYALGAGAKSFSYWWYTPYGQFHGCGAADDEAVALWRQIGLLGAQVRTAGPVLERSCPATVPLRASAKLWTHTLLAGTDTLVLLAVNDNIASDRLGSVVVPLPNTTVALTPPAWLQTADAFEITPEGLRNVNWRLPDGQVVFDLGKTEVSRLVMITSNKGLRGQLDNLYRGSFAANAGRLLAAGAK
jgi:hypothetical protein